MSYHPEQDTGDMALIRSLRQEVIAFRSSEVKLKRKLDAAQREIAGLRSQIACLERQLAESDEATKRAWREAGRAEG